MSKGQMNDMFKQMEELFSKVNKLTKEVKTQNKEIKSLKEQLLEKHKKHIVYGDNLKALAVDLMYESHNSTDATKNIISSISDNCLVIPKSTLIGQLKQKKN